MSSAEAIMTWNRPKTALVAALTIFAGASAADQPGPRTTANLRPRKVIVGTSMKAFWVKYPGLDKRLAELTGLVDAMAAAAQKQYGRGLDLAVLPETSVTGEVNGNIVASSVALNGPLKSVFSKCARDHGCYIVVPTYLLDDEATKRCSNAAILFNRNGEVAGIYRKVHLAVAEGSDSMEAGTTPGKQAQVFQCDFGKLGMQVCFDMEYDYGWNELARQGADLVAWPTQSPQTSQPAARAADNHYYIVSSTWRNNASIFEPTGKITAQIREPEHILVREIDLSYAILPWSSQLKNGAAFREKFGDKAGFRYYEDEDLGIFWSNDPRRAVGEMIRSMGLIEADQELERIRKLYRAAGVPGSD
jgi:predicted amidohydrolase